MAVARGEGDVEGYRGVGEALRRAHEQQPLPGVRALDPLEAQHAAVTRGRPAVLQQNRAQPVSVISALANSRGKPSPAAKEGSLIPLLSVYLQCSPFPKSTDVF